MVDQDGLPVRLLITAGQASDKTAFPDLLAGLPTTTVVADHGLTPLEQAATVGSLELVKFYVERGADVNSKDQYGFHRAGPGHKRSAPRTSQTIFVLMAARDGTWAHPPPRQAPEPQLVHTRNCGVGKGAAFGPAAGPVLQALGIEAKSSKPAIVLDQGVR